MSATLSTTRRNVRLALKDTDPQRYAFAGAEVDRALLASSLKVGAEIGLGLDWDTSVVTFTVGSTADYTLGAATTQWQSVVLGRISNTGDTMERVSFDEINQRREGLLSSSTSSAVPRYFALWEDGSQIVQMRIDCIPSQAYSVDFLRSNMPSATVADSTTLPFSDLGLRAVEFDACGTLAAKASPELLARLGLGPQAASKFMAEAQQCIELDRRRRAQLSRKAYGVGAILGR